MSVKRRARRLMRRVLDGHGGQAVLERRQSTYDPAAGKTTETVEQYPVKVAIGTFRAEHVDGERIGATDVPVVVAAERLPVTPQAGDGLVLEGARREVVRVQGSYVGTQRIAHVCQVRL